MEDIERLLAQGRQEMAAESGRDLLPAEEASRVGAALLSIALRASGAASVIAEADRDELCSGLSVLEGELAALRESLAGTSG